MRDVVCFPDLVIVCYHWNDFTEFFEKHDYITTKLSCLCWDAIELSYIKIVLPTVAAFGIHLVSSSTEVDVDHTQLQSYFQEL